MANHEQNNQPLRQQRSEELRLKPSVRGTTTQDRFRWMLKEMDRRSEYGLPVSCRGFPPYNPIGARLVEQGLARLERRGTFRSATSYLRITEAGEKELARILKSEARRERKYG